MNRIKAILLSLFLCFLMISCGNITEGKSKETTKKGEKIEFEEVIVMDEDEYAIKIIGIKEDNTNGYIVEVNLENKSNENTYEYSLEHSFINGVDIDGYLYHETVEPGKSINYEIDFNKKDIKKIGIEENQIEKLSSIELTFIVESDDEEIVDSATVKVYPFGEENTKKFVRESKNTDIVFVDNEFLTAIVTGYTWDEKGNLLIDMLFENKIDEEIMCNYYDISVNDWMINDYITLNIQPNTYLFDVLYISEEELSYLEITDIEEIEFWFRALNRENEVYDTLADEKVIFKLW